MSCQPAALVCLFPQSYAQVSGKAVEELNANRGVFLADRLKTVSPDGYIEKPIEPDKLIKVIKEALKE